MTLESWINFFIAKYVIFLHLPIGKRCSRQGDLLQTYFKIASLIIHYLGAFAVGEATAVSVALN
jgi:hypothetical protein